MTEPKKPALDEDTDWASALDEWEQKAFSSITPPPPDAAAPSVPPAPPEEPRVAPHAADHAAKAPTDDRTLASAGASRRPSAAPAVTIEAAEISTETLDVDPDVDLEETHRAAPRTRTSTPPPLPDPVTRKAIAIPPAPPPRVPAPRTSHAPRVPTLPAEVSAMLEEQAAWLEAEAGAAQEPVRARVLLALSEIRALMGDADRALGLATRARELAPDLALAHRQARSLAALSMDSTAEANALMAEEACSSFPAAKNHAALLTADVLRLGGDAEGARLKVSRVADSGEIRGVVGEVALGLADNDVEALAAFAAREEARPVAAGLASALRLRGVTSGAAGGQSSADVINDAFHSARLALEAGDTRAAASRVASLQSIPELAAGASWLAAALAATKEEGRADALLWLRQLAEGGDHRASRVVAARAIEADDGRAASAAIASGGFSPADELALSALLEIDVEARKGDAELPVEMGALRAAVPVLDTGSSPAGAEAATEALRARAARVVGSPRSRAAVRMARLLAGNAPPADLEAALVDLRDASPTEASALDLELSLREGAYARLSDRLQAWTSRESHARVTDAALASALVAERAGDPARALAAYREARRLDPASEVALRSIAALNAATDLPGELNDLADELGATADGALARLEAVIREDSVDDATRAELLSRAHRAAPAIPVASFLAERIAVRTANTDDALRWIEERRAVETDPTELAIGSVREARLLGDRDPRAAAARVASAHRQFPGDLALREYYERTLDGPAEDHATYWESQAASASGRSRALVYLDVAHAYERAGDPAGVLRATEAAGADLPLLRLARDRAELATGEAAALVDLLLGEAKSTTDPVIQREAYERLADIDGFGRRDPGSALLWHKAILEGTSTHLPSLRHVEQALVREGRDDELEPIAAAIANALPPGDGGERVAHADLAARLRGRGAEGDWDATYDVAKLAASDPVPSLSSLRLLHAHARARKDDALLITVSEQLLERASRPVEMAALHLRVAEAAFRDGDLVMAETSLEQGVAEDPGDLVAFRMLAEVRDSSGDPAGAAESHESVARLSLVPGHQLAAWYDAARLWQADGEHPDEAVQALEQAASIDLSYEDIFARLSALYASRSAFSDLAGLLDRRIALATSPDERVTLEVERGRALLSAGDRAAARLAVGAALQERPDHTTALATFAELSAVEEDWAAAEEAWVRLARLLSAPEEQRQVYQRLGELYSEKAVHLARAELAFKEVLKRAPGDPRTLERLVDIYRRQQDLSRAVEAQQELIQLSRDATEKRARTLELAALYEDPGHDERRAEQVLDAARRESPTDVVLLRALAEFYLRHKQTPAMNILLDRAAADARRAFAAGRFAPALFDIMCAIFELRGKDDAARIVGASLLAIEGKPADVSGGLGRALDPRLDDLLAPDVLTPGLRMLLARAGGMLDAAAPIDLRGMAAQPAGADARLVQELAGSFASLLRLDPPKIYVSKTIGRTCLPAASTPPALVIGESLLTAGNDRAVAFLVMRAMKLIAAKASALVRTSSTDLAVLVPAWMQVVVPSWTPQGVNPSALAVAARKLAQSPPPPVSEELTNLGLEVASQLGTRASTLGGLALAWANRAALLGVGDPNAALDALAWTVGSKDGAPTDEAARAAWIGRTHEAKDLLIFSIGDSYAEARSRLDLK